MIHDEAALACTREQHQLLSSVQAAGARLIEIGDPGQSQPVGAGGLWPGLEQAARGNDGQVQLTRNLRALDPEDRRDQRLFRDAQTEQALAGYHARGRVVLSKEQRQAEDRALEAAHADQQAGRQTVVIAQTSNVRLDQLNARAQALRHQHRELSQESLPVPGRPYSLRAGDRVQIRNTFQHPDHGAITNGSTGQITWVSPSRQCAGLKLDHGAELNLNGDHVQRGDLRLAYVQHPFPAQGQTTDTAHLIVSRHATQEGSYVAITRARQRTTIYAASTPDEQAAEAVEQLTALAEQMSRTQPDLPAIHTPLAHEHAISDQQARVIDTHEALRPSSRSSSPRSATQPRPVMSSRQRRTR